MKKALVVLLAAVLLLACCACGGTPSTSSTPSSTPSVPTTDTWVLFEGKELECLDETTMEWKVGDSTGKGLTCMGLYGMYCYVHPEYATIFKLVVSESGTLVFDSKNNIGCQNTSPGNEWINGVIEFAILDKNGKVIFPADGIPVTLNAGENLPIDLTVEVAAGDEFYFYHRNTATTQANFQTRLAIELNGNAINDTANGDLCSTDSTKYNTQGAGGWYYMYADATAVEITHSNPNNAGSGSANTGGSAGNIPETGDSAMTLWPLVMLMVASSASLVYLTTKKRKGV